MKSILLTGCLLLACIISLRAQQVPMGMNYQAVAREASGAVMADELLEIQVSLFAAQQAEKPVYTEHHSVATNALGLFSIIIGQGQKGKGAFDRVPWSAGEVWMEVAISNQAHGYELISRNQMLSVPYAMHAGSAGELVPAGDETRTPGDNPSAVWKLTGNGQTDPAEDKLGTTDAQDLVIVTSGVERIRVESEGDVTIDRQLHVGENLEVKENATLNTSGGETIVNGPFTVENASNTYLTGDLGADGATNLGSTLEVQGESLFHAAVESEAPVHITSTENATDIGTGALAVDGGVSVGQDLVVDGTVHANGSVQFGGEVHITSDSQSVSPLTGALTVEGGVGIQKNLNVGGLMNVKVNTPLWAASITNTNAEDGDGLVIRLGRTHPLWDGQSYRNITNVVDESYDYAIGNLRNWLRGNQSLSPEQLINGTFLPVAAGTACNLFNLMIDQISTGLGLPATVGPVQLTDEIVIVEDVLVIPPVIIPELVVVAGIDPVDCSDLPSYTVPNVAFGDVLNSLNENNVFISFEDKEERVLGSIYAESVLDWEERYFDSDFVLNIGSHIIGLDFVNGLYSIITEAQNFVNSHNAIGVVYSSGHGDYAEWLERVDANEFISGGDIVGVTGGKITKDLAHAEQIMAVSTQPIVLGNAPAEGSEHLGNKIAFMGQIPVKIMGPVTTGDYILGNASTPGYGIARHPQDMRPEDAPLVVGRAWETIDRDGPKKVNTVIGVDNGHVLKILQQYQVQLETMDERLTSIESLLKEPGQNIVDR